MNMSDYSCGAIKQLTKSPNERIEPDGFSWLDFGFKNPDRLWKTFVDT